MKVTIFGSGYVGLVTGTCLADAGNEVLCVDIDQDKVDRLNRGEVPIYEPGLESLILDNREAGRLAFTTDVASAVEHGVVQFIAVGTPPDEDGSADMQYVLTVARSIGEYIADYRVVVDKSTVPVGTADRVRATLAEVMGERGVSHPFSVVSNPEFLKEGAAVADFMKPDRIILGSEDERATRIMRDLYRPFSRSHDKLIVMDVRSAELTKYAANAMLATRISFMNEMANLAEELGVDIENVRRGIGSDPRIGYNFLYPGAGYGGSCFPKDVKALIHTARNTRKGGLRILESVEAVNAQQKQVLFGKITTRFGDDLAGRHFTVWGLAFKPNTDDMREAASIPLTNSLLDAGATVTAYDPAAMEEAKKEFGQREGLTYAEGPMRALPNADALVIVTEWNEFRSPDFNRIKTELKQPVIFDGRNLYNPAQMHKLGIEHYPIGRK